MSTSVVHVLKLSPKDDFIAKIREFVAEKGWQEAYVQGTIGSVIDVVLTNAAGNTLPPPVQATEVDGPFEMLSCTGEIIRQEQGYYTHIHISGSKTDATALGGGLRQANVFRQMKIYIQKIA